MPVAINPEEVVSTFCGPNYVHVAHPFRTATAGLVLDRSEEFISRARLNPINLGSYFSVTNRPFEARGGEPEESDIDMLISLAPIQF